MTIKNQHIFTTWVNTKAKTLTPEKVIERFAVRECNSTLRLFPWETVTGRTETLPFMYCNRYDAANTIITF